MIPYYAIEAQGVFDDPDPDVIGVYRIVYLPKGYWCGDPGERVVWETPWRRGEAFGDKLPARVRDRQLAFLAAILHG